MSALTTEEVRIILETAHYWKRDGWGNSRGHL